MPRPNRAGPLAALALLLCLDGCAPRPEPITYGSDVCEHCRMTITEQGFGAELVTTRGRVHRFDSVECLAAFYRAMPDPRAVHSLWVTDLTHPGRLVPVDDVRFVHAARLRSPMGEGLAAVADPAAADSMAAVLGGEVLDWAGVVALVPRARPGGHAAPPRAPAR